MKVINELSEIRREKLCVRDVVEKIRKDVVGKGVDGVLEWERKFRDVEKIEIPANDIMKQRPKGELEDSIRKMIRNVERVARMQKPSCWKLETEFGRLEERFIPFDSLLVYVPGGKYPLFSSAIMAIVSAKIAGVKNIYVTSPAIDGIVGYVSMLAGAKRFFNLSGAQSIFAFAYGIVDEVDMIAGPTEFVAVENMDENVAYDLMAQAEHVSGSFSLLISDSRDFIEKISEICKGFDNIYGMVVEREEMRKVVNSVAPEHLQLGEGFEFLSNARAGTVVMGKKKASAFADYGTGANHILPTNGGAKFRGGLSPRDFGRFVIIQTIENPSQLEFATTLAEAEGLSYHRISMEKRLGQIALHD